MIIITLSKLSLTSGVSSFWNALFKSFKSYDDMNFESLEIGGHGYNLFGPILDQWKFYRTLKKDSSLVCLNPSLINRSFFRDGLFAKQCINQKKPFMVFFHGWELEFEEQVSTKYLKFFQNSFGKADKIFVLSQDFKMKLLEWGYGGEIVVERSNVDIGLIKNFSMQERKKVLDNLEPIKILFLARLIKEKGIFELIEAVEELVKKGKNIELIVAGDGADYALLEERVQNIENIRVLGDVQGDEKIALFKEAHMYVLASYTEGLPISVLEAMLFALPVITTNVGGLKYFIEEGKMGYLVESKSRASLIAKIALLIEDSKKMREISKYNFEYAQKELTNEMMAKRLHKHFREYV